MIGKVLCFFGFHDWITKINVLKHIIESGNVCKRCGKEHIIKVREW